MEQTTFPPHRDDEEDFDLDIRVIVIEESDDDGSDRPGFSGGFITCNCSHHPPYTVLLSDMVDNSINLSKPISGWFIRSGQIRQAFSSPSEAPFELFCEFIHPFPMT